MKTVSIGQYSPKFLHETFTRELEAGGYLVLEALWCSLHWLVCIKCHREHKEWLQFASCYCSDRNDFKIPNPSKSLTRTASCTCILPMETVCSRHRSDVVVTKSSLRSCGEPPRKNAGICQPKEGAFHKPLISSVIVPFGLHVTTSKLCKPGVVGTWSIPYPSVRWFSQYMSRFHVVQNSLRPKKSVCHTWKENFGHPSRPWTM